MAQILGLFTQKIRHLIEVGTHKNLLKPQVGQDFLVATFCAILVKRLPLVAKYLKKLIDL